MKRLFFAFLISFSIQSSENTKYELKIKYYPSVIAYRTPQYFSKKILDLTFSLDMNTKINDLAKIIAEHIKNIRKDKIFISNDIMTHLPLKHSLKDLEQKYSFNFKENFLTAINISEVEDKPGI